MCHMDLDRQYFQYVLWYGHGLQSKYKMIMEWKDKASGDWLKTVLIGEFLIFCNFLYCIHIKIERIL